MLTPAQCGIATVTLPHGVKKMWMCLRQSVKTERTEPNSWRSRQAGFQNDASRPCIVVFPGFSRPEDVSTTREL